MRINLQKDFNGVRDIRIFERTFKRQASHHTDFTRRTSKVNKQIFSSAGDYDIAKKIDGVFFSICHSIHET